MEIFVGVNMDINLINNCTCIYTRHHALLLFVKALVLFKYYLKYI